MYMTMKERSAWMKSRLEGFPKSHMLPAYKAVGMRDVVADGCGYGAGDPWMEIWDIITDACKVNEGGRMDYVIPIGISYYLDDYSYHLYNIMELSEMYLCTDGRVRYKSSPELQQKIKEADKRSEEEQWADINAAFEERGFFFDEDKCCWVNPETGEEDCY